MLRNVLANCKFYDSQADWLNANSYVLIKFLLPLSSLVAGVKFAKYDRNRLL